MLQRFKVLRAASIVMTLISLGFCAYNWNGAFSQQYKGINTIAFGASVGIPVALAVIAFILGLMAWGAVKSIETEEKEKREAGGSVGADNK